MRQVPPKRGLCSGRVCSERQRCVRHLDLVQVLERGPRHQAQAYLAVPAAQQGRGCPYFLEDRP